MADYTLTEITERLGREFWVELTFHGCSYWHCLRIVGVVVPTESNQMGYFLAFDLGLSEQYPCEYFWQDISFMTPAKSYRFCRKHNEKTPH